LGGVASKYNFPVDIPTIKDLTYKIYEEIVEGNLTPLPGVKDFIRKAKSMRLKLAVATSADRVKMEVNLRNIGISEGTFMATVNGLEVKRKKPFPDIFEKAAEKIGINPKECLVVEDAVNGVQAAKAAGAKCLALTTSFPKSEFKLADWVSGTLADAPNEALTW
jgi:HAD superfamily hydrolase (TIGR01509 family)